MLFWGPHGSCHLLISIPAPIPSLAWFRIGFPGLPAKFSVFGFWHWLFSALLGWASAGLRPPMGCPSQCLPKGLLCVTYLTGSYRGKPGIQAEVEPARLEDGQPWFYYRLPREEPGCLAGAVGRDNNQSLLSAFMCYYLIYSPQQACETRIMMVIIILIHR